MPPNFKSYLNDSKNNMIFDSIFQWDDWTCWPWIYGRVFSLLWLIISRRWAFCSAGNYTNGVLSLSQFYYNVLVL